MIYKLVIHKRAAIEAKNIAIYIRDILCNPQAAKNFVRAMEEEKPNISQRPNSYPYRIINGKVYRFAVIKKYLMFFQVDENNKTVYIKSIMYGRRNYQKQL